LRWHPLKPSPDRALEDKYAGEHLASSGCHQGELQLKFAVWDGNDQDLNFVSSVWLAADPSEWDVDGWRSLMKSEL